MSCTQQMHTDLKAKGFNHFMHVTQFQGIQDFGGGNRLILGNCNICNSTLAIALTDTPADAHT